MEAYYSTGGIIGVVVALVVALILALVWHAFEGSTFGATHVGFKLFLCEAFAVIICLMFWNPPVLWSCLSSDLKKPWELQVKSVRVGDAREIAKTAGALTVNGLYTVVANDLPMDEKEYKEVRLAKGIGVERYILVEHQHLLDDYGLDSNTGDCDKKGKEPKKEAGKKKEKVTKAEVEETEAEVEETEADIEETEAEVEETEAEVEEPVTAD